MSASGRVGVGIPTVMLYEGEGHTITVENRKGELYKGLLVRADDNMNVKMKNVIYTDLKGKETKLDEIFIRGSKIFFISLPDILEHAPVFERLKKHKKTKGKYTPQGSGTARAGRKYG